MHQANKTFRPFLLLWLGQLIAVLGHGVSSFALGLHVYTLTHKATAISMVSLAAFLPSILLAPLAGALADRWDRRLLMMIADGVSSLGLIAILALNLMGQLTIWSTLLAVSFSSIFQALLEPAYRASISDMLSEADYAKASGLVQLASSTKFLIAPVIGGFLMTGANGINLALLVDISTVLVTLATTQIVRKHWPGDFAANKQVDSLWLQVKEGASYLKTNPDILYLMIFSTCITFYLGSIQVLIQPLVLTVGDSQNLGQVISLGATGMLISSLLIGWKGIPAAQELKCLIIASCLCGLFIIGLGLSDKLHYITLTIFLIFSSLPIMTTALETLMRFIIPVTIQGRTWGTLSFLSQLGYLIAYLLAGPMADYIFEPLASSSSHLINSQLGHWLGNGPGRGISLLFIIAGLFLVASTFILVQLKPIKQMSHYMHQ